MLSKHSLYWKKGKGDTFILLSTCLKHVSSYFKCKGESRWQTKSNTNTPWGESLTRSLRV